MVGLPDLPFDLHGLALTATGRIMQRMGQRDENVQAVKHVEEATESEPVRGEHLLDSPDLKRKLEDAKKALRPELPAGDPSDASKP